MSSPETRVQFSENESTLLGLKIGRCVSTGFDAEDLVRQVVEGRYDICRLTVPASEEDAVMKLEKTGLPYYYSGGITRFKTKIPDIPERVFIHPELAYEEYDGSQNELLLYLLKGTWGTYPIGYYRTPFLSHLVSKEQEILCVFEFYKKNNLKANNPNNTIMFIRHGENYVGFFALNIIGDRLESHIGGIVEPYRSGGYFFDMQEYIRRFCIKNNLQYFAFGARNENRRVQGIFQKFGYVAVDADNVFHLAPMLTYAGYTKTINQELILKSDDPAELYTILYPIGKKAGYPLTRISKFSLLSIEGLRAGKTNACITFPVATTPENMVVAKIHDESGKLCAVAYLLAQ